MSTTPRWARVRSELAHRHPGIPKDWCPVVPTLPGAALHPEPMEDYCWVKAPHKTLHVPERFLEFRETEP